MFVEEFNEPVLVYQLTKVMFVFAMSENNIFM